MKVPKAATQTHHLSADGSESRTMSRTMSATAQPAVIVPVMTRSLPSSGGGDGRSGRLTPLAYLSAGICGPGDLGKIIELAALCQAAGPELTVV